MSTHPADAPVRLGVNIDHVATLRNARGGLHPDTVRAAEECLRAGADGITVHLREDRRHIKDADVRRIAERVSAPLNLEMAATKEMQAIALEIRPNAVCLVPERREERTTEGGLDVVADAARLKDFIAPLAAADIRVSLFIEPEAVQIASALACGAEVVELHTGSFCNAAIAGDGRQTAIERARMFGAAKAAAKQGLEVHAGHGITFDTVGDIAAIPEVRELNIGHFLVGEAVFIGLPAAVKKMRAAIAEARQGLAA